jgi:hypothetical protein
MSASENKSASTGATSTTDGTAKRPIPVVWRLRILIFVATVLSGTATGLAWVHYQHSEQLCIRAEQAAAHYKATLAAIADFISPEARQKIEAEAQPSLAAFTVAAAKTKICRSLTFCAAAMLVICFLLLIFNGWRSPPVTCIAFSILGLAALFTVIYMARFRTAGGWAPSSDEKTSWMPIVFLLQVALVFIGAAGVWAGMKWRAVKRECETNSA